MNHFQLITMTAAFILCLTIDQVNAQSVPFVIPGDDATESATDFSNLLSKPAGDSEFVSIQDGQFFVGNRRLRFWGMNLCFGANFPTHEEADKIAPHLAKLGCNAVRFHHMDMLDAPAGIWQTNEDGSRTFSPEQVDRLDYFLAKLHENGIYANINLHVSRTLTEAEGFPEKTEGPWWSTSNKWVMYYDPDVQATLKQYCRELLEHENPYRKLKRCDDPGIALVEMLNENYFSVQGNSLLKLLPDRYVRSYQKKWNQWLVAKYKTHEKLKSAWQPASRKSDSEPVFKPADWNENLGDWSFNKNTPHEYRPAEFDSSVSALRLEPKEKFEQHHLRQLSNYNLAITKDEACELSFWIRSDEEREYTIEVSSVKGGSWRSIGLFEAGRSTRKWTEVRHWFVPTETNNEAYVAFSLGTSDIPLELANVRLIRAADGEIPAGQRLDDGTIGVPDASFPIAAVMAHKHFMIDTERAWVTELRDFLRNEIGVKVPITASQENYHAPGVLADTVDYIDLHTYWHHPTFPAGKEFNPTEYRTGNVPIEIQPLKTGWPAHNLINRAGWRYHGMPFTLSEWNHAEPGDFNTGAIMMAAALGAIQDWDGIFFFDYESEHGRWFSEHYDGFFDFNSQPAKLAVFSVASNIFLRGDLSALPTKMSGTFDDRIAGHLAFLHQLGIDIKADEPDLVDTQSADPPSELLFKTPDGSLIWDATEESKSHLMLNTPRSSGVWGLIANQRFEVGPIEVAIGPIERDYGTIVLTALDDQPVSDSSRMLLLASSGAENTAMKWNADRTSVSDQWGTGPTQVNLVPAEISLTLGNAVGNSVENEFTIYALDGTGARVSEVDSEQLDGKLTFKIGSPHKTIWYELTKNPALR
jgi:hypothetical protein